MEYEKFAIEGPALIKPKRYEDTRGYFMETFRENWFRENIADVEFVQDNQSFSFIKNTIRGLHFQKQPFEQGKLVSCSKGSIFDVAVDIRANSPSFGMWISAELSALNGYQLWIPQGFAHGFCTLESECVVAYKVTQYYSQNHDAGIAYDDEKLNIKWPINHVAVVSEKDKKQPEFINLYK
ncbi:MAG: dTDP-4-dehydrorhamnose 3,5-epimerase [Caulobacterales bacterium]|nr:dTDP-4-dehydrorhamnose 3,5-epimerase [Caulobacterales bacterium]MCA0373391.1 dTDP-4-dehydrorhamnose 3,5-epimerase [Pseudomonadota bacterium]